MGSGGLQAILDLMAERAQALTHAAGAALLILEGSELAVRAATGLLAESHDSRHDPGTSALGTWVELGLPLRFDDATEDPQVAAAALSPEARSVAVAPVRHEGRVAGLLLVVQPEPSRFRP